MDKHKHPRFWLLPDKNDECKICQFKTLCGGGCPLTKIIAYGNVNEKSPFCPTFKKVFPVLLKIRSKWITQKNQTKFQELVRKDFPKDTTVSNIG
jgi:sulfatase maturation enzyme AslB (radical SAM superfamily)